MGRRELQKTVNGYLNGINKIDDESFVATIYLPFEQKTYELGFKIDAKDFEDETITLMKTDGSISTKRLHFDENGMDWIMFLANPIIRYMKKRGFFKSSPQLPMNIQGKVDIIVKDYLNAYSNVVFGVTYLFDKQGKITIVPHNYQTNIEKDKFYKKTKKMCNEPNYICILNILLGDPPLSQDAKKEANVENEQKPILIIQVETRDYFAIKVYEDIDGNLIDKDKFGDLRLAEGRFLNWYD